MSASPALPPECLVWVGLLVFCNLPFGGVSPVARWTFLPDLVAAGEWWRVITFPFVHVSGYHLLLDAGAFLGLYAMWEERSAWRRVGLVGASCLGSLAGAACVADFAQLGLCGLSGPAHGLAVLVALESIRAESRGRRARFAGWTVLLVVVAKSVAEAFSGQVIFGGFHPGSVGVPNPVCHAGGVAGALLCGLTARLLNRDRVVPCHLSADASRMLSR